MRLHRIRLEDFRGVADREVCFASTGITVVDGPNEIGKSSLGDALDMVLRRHDSSEARDVRSAAPAGRDVGPFVEVEMSTGPYRFILAKRWLRGRMTRLDVLEPRRRQLTGREAHDAVEEMLAETLDADLWTALRVAQGTADGPVDVHTRSLARVLDGAMGVESSGGDERLVERIEGERLQYWTPTGRPRGERVELAREVSELDERESEVLGQLEELVHAASRVEELGIHLAELTADRAGAEAAVAAATERVAALAEARRRVEVVERGAESARAHHLAALAAVDRRHELIDDVESARADLAKLRLDLERSAAAAGDADAEERSAVAALDAARREIASLDRQVRDLETRRDRVADLARLDALRERIDSATAAGSARDAASRALATLARVDADSLAAVETAATALVVANARLDGASARIDVEALDPLDLAVDGVAERISAGAHREWTAAETRTFEFADRFRLTVSPGQGAADLLAAVDGARRRLEDLCADLGVPDADAARVAHQSRRTTEAELAAASAELSRVLGASTLDGLIADAAALEARLEDDSSSNDAPDLPADVDLESAWEGARAQLSALRTRHDDLAADADHHRERAQRARVDDTTLVGRIEQADSHHARVAARLEQARSATADAALDAATASGLAERESAEMALGAARRELAALHPDELEADLARCDAHLAGLNDTIASTSSEIDRLQARLDVGGEQGLATELDDIRTRRAHLDRRLAGLERSAAAARRLHESVEAQRDVARRRYAAPFREELERLGRLVFGPDLELELDDDLHVIRRVLDGNVLDVDQLSVGAREQLGLLARLACASIVSTDGGAPVMFDDVLGHSDPDRVAAMGRALVASARDGQVIITTCAPERYEGLDAARVTLA